MDDGALLIYQIFGELSPISMFRYGQAFLNIFNIFSVLSRLSSNFHCIPWSTGSWMFIALPLQVGETEYKLLGGFRNDLINEGAKMQLHPRIQE